MKHLISVHLRIGLFASFLLASTVAASDKVPGPVAAIVVRVLDGDSLKVRAQIWLETEVEVVARLKGIDAPELHAKCESERTQALAARQRLEELAPIGSAVWLVDIQHDKYHGRVVARVNDQAGQDLGAVILAAGLARPYDGHRRRSWCLRG